MTHETKADKAETSRDEKAAAEKARADASIPVYLTRPPAAAPKKIEPPTIEVPEGRDPPATLSETLAVREEASEEARTNNPEVSAASIMPRDTSAPSDRVTTTSPPMGVPDDTKFTSPKDTETKTAPKSQASGRRR